MSLVAYGGSSESEEEQDSPVLKSNGGGKGQDLRKLLSVLPAPSKGKKQPVKLLGIPSLKPSGSSDESDSDEDRPKAKRKGRGGGLTSMLPRPKQASKLVSSKTTNNAPSSMIPYSLTKRPTTQPAARRGRKGVASRGVASATKEDSDSDGEPTSFFSHLETTPTTSQSSIQPLFPSSSHGNSGGSGTVLYDTAPSAPKPFSISEEVYEFPEPVLSGDWGQEEGASGQHQELSTQPSGPTQPYLSAQPSASVSQPSLPAHTPTQQPGRTAEAGPVLGAAGPGLSMDEHTYRRFTGAKRKRGRDPSLNDLIEINEDEVKIEMENYRRHNSDDTVDKLYKPPEGEKPTGQQKKKHQITYLAHEAKANELMYLKQWGAAAATRRDTQMKYGF